MIDLKNLYQSGMSELVEFVKYQEWLHLFNIIVLEVRKKDVREFYYEIIYIEDNLS